MNGSLLGTARHRAIVQAVLEAYADDESILTIGVFGSLARADGDEYSDVDLDAVIPAEAVASAATKIERLVDHLNRSDLPVLLVVWDGDRAAEILLKSLDRIDITFHAPEASKAEVLRDLILIRGDRGSLPAECRPAIEPRDVEARLRRLHEKFPISALQVAVNLRRGRLWYAITLLEEMRRCVMGIYGLSRGSTLPERYFVKLAEDEVRQRLGETLTTYRPDSIAAGLLRVVELYRYRCVWLSNGRLAVTPEQETVFDHVVAGLRS